jgi:hypothetical protein
MRCYVLLAGFVGLERGRAAVAIYRFEAKIIGRSDRVGGRSVVACAAYRSGTRLHSEKYDVTHDYSRRTAGIEYEGIHSPECSPSSVTDRGALWNGIEAKEDTHNRRAKAQLARELLPSIPAELNKEQRKALVIGFVESELVSRGMVADVSIHAPKEGKNYHAHILCSLREVSPEGFGLKVREWNTKPFLIELREAWDKHSNAALEDADSKVRVDHRSLEDRGIDRLPEPKIGVAASAMERKGIPTEKGHRAMMVKMDNHMRAAVRNIQRSAEWLFRYEPGKDWFEKLHNGMNRINEAAIEFARDESSGGSPSPPTSAPKSSPAPEPSHWQDYVQTRQKEPDHGMEMG